MLFYFVYNTIIKTFSLFDNKYHIMTCLINIINMDIEINKYNNRNY